MMLQYTEIKAANPDCLLFYRMGDFYELFFEDAVAASGALGIALTKRGKHRGEDIPMCGVPIHAADEYLQRLIKRGFRVAVCEQMEDPAEAKKRGSKAVVRRDVIRLVTTYESGLYGLQKFKSTNGYEARRQAAFAEVSSTKIKAAAAASAIAFVPVKLSPGQSTDGAVFWATQGKPLGAGRLRVHAAGEDFDFTPEPPAHP